MNNPKNTMLTPLYFDMIINQFPEAAELLGNIVRYCRYRQHEDGMGFDRDDYYRFIQDKKAQKHSQIYGTTSF